MTAREALSPRLWAHLLFLRPLVKLVFGLTQRGGHHLLDLDRFVLIANHNSHLDTLVLFAALPVSRILNTHPVAAADYFRRTRLLGFLVEKILRPVWLDRENPGGALGAMQERLDEGGSLILFPEGTRGEAGQLQPFRAGVGHLLARNRHLPVLTAFLEGPERALPRSASMPLPLWNHVSIGPPRLLEGKARDMTALLEEGMRDAAKRAAERRHRRPDGRGRAFTFGVLGIDGSGKSTLSRRLALELEPEGESALISDRLELFRRGRPAEMQPLMVERLRRWIGAQAKTAKSLVSYKIPKLTELLLRDRLMTEACRWYGPSALLMDGVPLFNLTAWAVLYKEGYDAELCRKALLALSRGARALPARDPAYDELPELKTLLRLPLLPLHLPAGLVFLDVDPAEAIRRISLRGEQRQVHETEEKLSKLREAYLMVCEVARRDLGLPVMVLDGNRPLETVVEEAAAFARRTREEACAST